MRTVSRTVFALAALALAAGPATAQQFESVPQGQPAAPAPAASGVKIGLISVQAAMLRTQEGRKAGEDLRAQFAPRQAELEKMQEEIRDIDNQLRTQGRTLSEDAQFQLGRQLEQKRKQFTRMQQDYEEDAEAAQNDIIARLSPKIRQVMDRYARENGLTLILNVFDGGPVVWAIPTVDITDAIVRLYDQSFPVASAAAPAGPQPPASRSAQPQPARPRPQTQNPPPSKP
jgi:outer membrane protein